MDAQNPTTLGASSSGALQEAQLVAEITKVIPEAAWRRIVETACTTFDDCMAPLTNLTSGVGRLIKARFDRLTDIEKVLATHAIEEAKRRLDEEHLSTKPIENPKTVLESIAGVSSETSIELHALWANLLAKEMATGSVHPEIPRVLSRMTPEDARLLADISTKARSVSRLISFTLSAQRRSPSPIDFIFQQHFRKSIRVNHGVLEGLNLIREDSGSWRVTVFGEAFIAVVSDSTAHTNEPGDDQKAQPGSGNPAPDIAPQSTQ